MSNEEFYDKEVAPAVLALGKQCHARGMSFLASVEFNPVTGSVGRTDFQMPDEVGKLSAAQRLIHWAARSDGNIDRLFMACDKHGRQHGHSSIYLQLAGNKNVKYTGDEVAVIAVISPSQKGGAS
jgi:hypothetical protein